LPTEAHLKPPRSHIQRTNCSVELGEDGVTSKPTHAVPTLTRHDVGARKLIYSGNTSMQALPLKSTVVAVDMVPPVDFSLTLQGNLESSQREAHSS
jgi:hypothetical protein